MKEMHAISYNESQFDILADRGARNTSRVFDLCPMCGKKMSAMTALGHI